VGDLTAEIASLAVEGQGTQIAPPDAFRRLAMDYAAKAPDRILAAGLAAQRAAERWCRAFAPSLEERIESVPAGLFDLHDLDEAIAALSEPRVVLRDGASLAIEPTEALTAIDVNAGPESNTLSVNLTAAQEIARQLRLRHIGGIVVIDFISMSRERDRDQVMEALKAAVADDPSQTYIVPMSPLGLVEMTRERRGPGLESKIDAQ
jgi:ribonuclease E/ribonuclease G